MKKLTILFIVFCFFGAISAQAADFGFTAETKEAIESSVNTFAERASASLKAIKIDLEKDIAELKAQEVATEQSVEGQQINDAVGDDTFVTPSRSTGTPAQTFTRIAKQFLLLMINIGIYILEHKVLLYITLVLLAFFVLRLLWRMGRQQF